MTKRFVGNLVLVGFLLIVVSGCGQSVSDPANPSQDHSDRTEPSDRTVIRYGHVPSISASERLDQLQPLKNYLEKKLPIELKIEFSEDYGQVVEQINNGSYDFVTFGPLSYVEAQQQGKLVPLVKPIRFGKTHYRSIIFSHKQSDIESVSDLKGKNFAFVDRKSTSGYLFPKAYLKEQGIDIETDLSGYTFMGSHSNVVVGIWLQKYSAGAVYDDPRKDHDKSSQIVENTKVIARTQKIPNEPWAFQKEFVSKHDELTDRIQSLLVALDKSGPSQRRILERLEIDGFAKAKDRDYKIIRKYQEYLK